MERRKSPIAVNRKSEVKDHPDLNIIIANTPARVFKSLMAAGSKGITCRDWHGYDLRHHLRVLRNSGIGIDRIWEKHDGGQHGRWKLRPGHSYQEVLDPKKTKPLTGATVAASNPNPISEMGGLNQ